MSALRAALISFITLTSFIILSIFFASLYSTNSKGTSKTTNGYDVIEKNFPSKKSYKTAFTRIDAS